MVNSSASEHFRSFTVRFAALSSEMSISCIEVFLQHDDELVLRRIVVDPSYIRNLSESPPPKEPCALLVDAAEEMDGFGVTKVDVGEKTHLARILLKYVPPEIPYARRAYSSGPKALAGVRKCLAQMRRGDASEAKANTYVLGIPGDAFQQLSKYLGENGRALHRPGNDMRGGPRSRSDPKDIPKHVTASRPDHEVDDPAACFLGDTLLARQVREEIRLVAHPQDERSVVLITGATGTGKEVVAKAIHRISRVAGEFRAYNCSTIIGDMADPKLFGHTEGAFTGATKAADGIFASADSGTLFLDEIGELPFPTQAMLLRAVQEGEFLPIGSNVVHRTNAQIVVATNRDLRTEVACGRFREDLYHRLTEWIIELPTLDARREDIPLLANHFWASFESRCGALPSDHIAVLAHAEWPGNVRTLQYTLFWLGKRCCRTGCMPSAAELGQKILRSLPLASVTVADHEEPVGSALPAAIHRTQEEAVPADSFEPVDLYATYRPYANAPRSLSDFIKVTEFRALVEQRTKDFVGRHFLFEAIDSFLHEPDMTSGYIVIRGEPGIGKTAIIAELVKRHGYVHHFNIASQNIRSPKDFLQNTCAQLIVHYSLPYDALRFDAGSNSSFLSRLLTEAVNAAASNRVVVLVDALDESDDTSLPYANNNRLFLPSALPHGVFFIVSARNEHDLRLKVDSRKDIYLNDNDPRNLDDVVRYIRNTIEASASLFSRCITDWGVSENAFIDTIKDKSEGNFMYLVHVLRDIKNGNLTADTIADINKLPKGLYDYYQSHWRAMMVKDTQRFSSLQEPVVCTLAVVREPVTLTQLAHWVQRITDVSLTPRLLKSVIDEWQEFLDDQVSAEGDCFYRLYHTSFQDFLKKEVGLTPYDTNIANTALEKIPGFLSGGTL